MGSTKDMTSASKSRIRVVLAEDHAVTRIGLKFIIEKFPNLELLAEAANGEEAVQFAASLQPDVAVLDVDMPVMDGIEAARLIRQSQPHIKVLMLTGSKDEKQIFAALSAGVHGYCIKDVSDDRLCTAIESVYRGDLWLDATIADKVIKALPLPSTGKNVAPGQLSERELEVLRLIVDGMSNQQIAQQLFISNDTVKTHIKHILEKLAAGDRTQAAVKALRQGLI